uniref:Response regulator n=1 Tax=Schlesneria paludicola TaxID=360056 RepID=A0A7C4LQ59_9PLAN
MTATRSVLVIDGSADTNAVLQAVLEPRGTQVRRARGHRLSTDGTPPDLIVIDLDNSVADSPPSPWHHTPQIVISSQRVDIHESQTRFLEKPFHYPELIRAVEELLAERGSSAA